MYNIKSNWTPTSPSHPSVNDCVLHEQIISKSQAEENIRRLQQITITRAEQSECNAGARDGAKQNPPRTP